jgi:hypothetical protein
MVPGFGEFLIIEAGAFSIQVSPFYENHISVKTLKRMVL